MKKALDMLVYTSVPLGNIAVLVGYEDVSYFTRIFKKKMGCTPGQVRKIRFRGNVPWRLPMYKFFIIYTWAAYCEPGLRQQE